MTALNHDGLTPLGVACAAGNWRLARFLLERGAYPEPAEATPALLEAAGGDEDDPNRKSTRLTPVTNAHLVCRLLLEKKNIINAIHKTIFDHYIKFKIVSTVHIRLLN